MLKNNKIPELVSPAGDWSSLLGACQGGADSVYFGVKGLNMRNLADNFDLLEIKKVVNVLHDKGVKGYLALNTIAYNSDFTKIKEILKQAKKAKVDGVILWDMGILLLAKKMGLNIHLSTQASVSNFLALKNYSSQGVSRVVLARECHIPDIRDIIYKINKEKINCTVEAFIHGAMCISVSGRCFLSEYSFSKSANRGECLQPCRREFTIYDEDNECQYILGKDYLLSSKDLCVIDFIEKLIELGISAFKIEGRMRSPEYVKVATSVYRRAIDAYFNKTLTQRLKENLKKELTSVYNRGFSSGFYLGKPKEAISRVLENTHEKIYAGEVVKFYKKISVAEIRARGDNIEKGQEILFLGKNTSPSFTIINSIQINHESVDKIKKGQTGGVKLPFAVKRKDKVFIWREK